MNRNDFVPIILGSDENAYGNVRLIHETYQVRPLLLCTRLLIPTMHSNLFDLIRIDGFDQEDVFPGALLSILEKHAAPNKKLIVIPCSDYYAGMLSRHYDKFKGLIANHFISGALLDTLDTKDKFYELCERFGLDYPKTVVCGPHEREGALERMDFQFPIVVKPENSNAYEYLHCHFEGKKKVFFFDNREDYLTMVRNMNTSDYNGKLILQEFIPGGDSAMRVINSYSDDNGQVKMMCLGQPVLEEYAPKTLGNYAAIISRSDMDIYEKVKAFLEKIGYVGFSNIDMKFDCRTGKYMMFEINPRLGRSSLFVRAAGLNMLEALINQVVYGKDDDVVYSKATALWTNVPRTVLKRYVTDPALSAEINRLYGQKKVIRSLWYNKDLNLKRMLSVTRYAYGHIKNYRRYYFDKGQASFAELQELGE
ncbi:ATP-grasp domain-containing protein [Paenibacillus rhizovicinus]|uniref:ATP-grasp domain-containing protein n=1 Tax=Paenibacillus rhizovicinus TaxID=2704463 RepID=A0A6C0P672_9BACL|nr:ATP-grasp domain-containing protein [Paenibacillus rhizovicinus]QHW33841.1 ATP-grasp domain-containing protein [Paenibacillus rhizovicinus]